jgi:hypothetical protein
MKNIFRNSLIFLGLVLVAFFVWQYFKAPPMDADWKPEFSVLSTAEFNKNLVTIKNVRNFRYSSNEENNYPGYYDKTYDLDKISKVWYIVEPFKNRNYAAHTFLSFEFLDGKYITISVEARKKKGENYSLIMGMFKTYPLMYIAADERDSIMLRTNTRKDDVYLYPAKATPEQTRLLFVSMLEKMNSLAEKPEWYNTFTANCTSSIADHVNKIWPKRLPKFMWQEWITGYAEKLVFNQGLIDTNLSFQEARKRYYITKLSQEAGDTENYSERIRQFDNVE